MTDYDPYVAIPPECKGRHAHGSSVPGWIIDHLMAGKPLVLDPATRSCAEKVIAYLESMAPENIIYRGLPEMFVHLSKRWDDPSQRSRLLADMATRSPENLRQYFSPHMTEEENVKLWMARFRAYIDAIESVALDNVIPEPDPDSAVDLFYAKF